MVKGIKNPIGSNILAVNLRTDLFVSRSALPYLYNSEKSKSNSSVMVFHVTPKTFTNACDDSTFPGVVAALAYDSSSSLVWVVFDFDPSHSCSRFLIAFNSFFELEFHFCRLNPSSDMIYFDFSYTENALLTLSSPVIKSSTYKDSSVI